MKAVGYNHQEATHTAGVDMLAVLHITVGFLQLTVCTLQTCYFLKDFDYKSPIEARVHVRPWFSCISKALSTIGCYSSKWAVTQGECFFGLSSANANLSNLLSLISPN
ncbi:hypothetical protein GOP47_0017259 [Adiantum capillus-veneris]|uniref:Uncharacterized protein n=1 Tax=Adiantum capillus-veneris TaxID=13818 RepID=A0A9D4UJ95_ADICA|nr:hypothetical protein GOP47_0017259 [Adiantum capillus-veneris]